MTGKPLSLRVSLACGDSRTRGRGRSSNLVPPETRAADLMVDHRLPALQSLPLPLPHRAFFTLSTWSRVRAFQPLFKGLSPRDGDKRPEGHTLGAGGTTELEFCPAPPRRLGKGPQRLPCLQTNLGSFISSRLLPPTKLPLCFLRSFHEHGHPHCSRPHRKWILSPSPGGSWLGGVGKAVWRERRPGFGLSAQGLRKMGSAGGLSIGCRMESLYMQSVPPPLPHSRQTGPPPPCLEDLTLSL